MITNSFDNQTNAIIEPQRKVGVPSVDVIIITFSYIIEEYLKEHFNCRLQRYILLPDLHLFIR